MPSFASAPPVVYVPHAQQQNVLHGPAMDGPTKTHDVLMHKRTRGARAVTQNMCTWFLKHALLLPFPFSAYYKEGKTSRLACRLGMSAGCVCVFECERGREWPSLPHKLPRRVHCVYVIRRKQTKRPQVEFRERIAASTRWLVGLAGVFRRSAGKDCVDGGSYSPSCNCLKPMRCETVDSP